MDSKVHENILNEFINGESIYAYNYFGAHFENREIIKVVDAPLNDDTTKNKVVKKKEIVKGVVFRLYAPNATDVSVIGDFNNWDHRTHKMKKVDNSGVFEIFIENLHNYSFYKYHFKNAKGEYVDKADPFAFLSEYRPGSCSRLFNIEGFIWHDRPYLNRRDRNFNRPMSIYEIHLGSFKGPVNGRYLSYEEVADYLIPYIKDLGYTHVEIMPITQYPFDGSWGYQATGFYSVDSRYGNPFQLMSFIDRLHQAGIGVILDFAPVHFAIDEWALKEFDGTCLYEYDNEHMFSPWGSCYFDLRKGNVRSFLMSAMNYFIEYFHFDGIRCDAVSNLIYREGDKRIGENTAGVDFVKKLNQKIHAAHENVMMIAEDSTDFNGVTKPLDQGGLGFDYKWDLGWMNDSLKYYKQNPKHKSNKKIHNYLTFSMSYFYSENFLLPLSHDEVVHGKRTILNKMSGSYTDKFALVRNLYTYMFAHPGKKLNFMGNELAAWEERNETKSIPWELKRFEKHKGVSRLTRDLNLIYQYHKAMYMEEYDPIHFKWLLVNNLKDSVFAFERRVGDSHLIFVFNMTSKSYNEYVVSLSKEGTYYELFNSDKDIYGGSNLFNKKNIKSTISSNDNKTNTLKIKLASYAACIFKYIND